MMFLFLIPFIAMGMVVAINFFYYLVNDRILARPAFWTITELWTLIAMPLLFLYTMDFNKKNDCCAEFASAVFAPGNSAGLYALIVACIITYFYTSLRDQLATPVAELLVNTILLLAAVLNVFVAIHLNKAELGEFIWPVGNIPIILLFIMMMEKNRKMMMEALQQNDPGPALPARNARLLLLSSKAWFLYPVVAVLVVPFLILFSLLLYLFGQKPDTLVRAFTDTYRHGFSELDHMCENIQCGGHFLCSVAAMGHKTIVQPQRYGERNGHRILCNRQLLVANAFEEMVAESLPAAHRFIRKQYDKVGNLIHRYYHVFNNPFLSDLVYIAMKPAEYLFVVLLYTFDRKPENRIARQYVEGMKNEE